MKNAKVIIAGGTLVLLLLAAVSYFVILMPRSAQAGEIDQQAQDVRDSNAMLMVKKNGLQNDLQNAPSQIASAREFQAQFPGSAELPALFTAIEAAAQAAGIPANDVTTVTPNSQTVQTGVVGAAAVPGTTGQSANMVVNVSATGPHDKLVAFQRNLQDLKRLFLIDTSSITDGADNGGYTLSVAGHMVLIDQTQLNTLINQVETLAGVPLTSPPGTDTVPASPSPAAGASPAPSPVDGATAPDATGAGSSPAPSPAASPAPTAGDATGAAGAAGAASGSSPAPLAGSSAAASPAAGSPASSASTPAPTGKGSPASQPTASGVR